LRSSGYSMCLQDHCAALGTCYGKLTLPLRERTNLAERSTSRCWRMRRGLMRQALCPRPSPLLRAVSFSHYGSPLGACEAAVFGVLGPFPCISSLRLVHGTGPNMLPVTSTGDAEVTEGVPVKGLEFPGIDAVFARLPHRKTGEKNHDSAATLQTFVRA